MVREKEKLKNMEKDFDVLLQDQVQKRLADLKDIRQNNKILEESLAKLQQDFKVTRLSAIMHTNTLGMTEFAFDLVRNLC